MNISWSKFFSLYYLTKQRLGIFIFRVASAFYFKVYLASIFSVNLINWIFAFVIRQQATGNTLILHYNVDFGIDYIAEVWRIFLLPLSGLAVNLVNVILVSIFYKFRQERLVFHLLFAGALIANLTILAALFALYLVNFS